MEKKYVEDYVKKESEVLDLEYELISKIIKLRESNNLSQKALADLINFKQPTIAKIELMKNSSRINTILKILIPLGYKLDIVPIDNK